MPVMLSCESLTKSFTSRPLFENLSFAINAGDHIGLIGPNGSGKTTLLKVIAGIEHPDSGTRAVRKGVRVGYVPQDAVFTPGLSIEEVMVDAMRHVTTLEDYEKSTRIGRALGKAGFNDRSIATDALSGGWRKRLAIARELALEPDILLLDEPTNHLDVEAILWLETLMKSEPEAFVVVSHDRYFLENVAKRMLELNRAYPDGLLQIDGRYSDFLVKRDELLRNEAAYQETLANRVRREVEWLRRGPKARTTKAKARITNADRIINELAEGRDRARVSTAKLDFTATDRRTKRLWVGKGLRKNGLFDDLDVLLTPGSRLGVLGPNGAGKTTLLRVIVGELAPDAGTIEQAGALRVVYFDQNRESLDPAKQLKDLLTPSEARRFLFRYEQLETSIAKLSGGEKARVILAQLIQKPADLLVLDEPTNDLDIPTLEVLEESLLEFPGALVLVTHDRYLIDRVSTQILALDGRGRAEYFADYSQWEDNRTSATQPERQPTTDNRQRAKRLGYLDQREFDAMEATVLAAEERLADARRRAEDPSIAADATALQQRFAEVAAAEAEVERLYRRWSELEAKS
jgi:ATP-binding cassette subfamily F protein uup